MAVTVAEPVVPPKQFTFVVAVILAASAAAGCVIVAVAPVCTGVVFQLYVYGAVPPVAVTVAEPVVAPKQFTFVVAVMLAVSAAAGSVMVAVAVIVQPPASVMVTV